MPHVFKGLRHKGAKAYPPHLQIPVLDFGNAIMVREADIEADCKVQVFLVNDGSQQLPVPFPGKQEREDGPLYVFPVPHPLRSLLQAFHVFSAAAAAFQYVTDAFIKALPRLVLLEIRLQVH